MTNIPISNSPFRVVPLPRYGQGGRWRTEAMRSYSNAILLWFTRGQGRITVSGNTRGYGPHNAIYLPAGTMHGFEMSSHVFGSIVYFPKAHHSELPAEATHIRFRESQQQAELTLLIENLQKECALELPGKDRGLELHGGVLSLWLERQIDIDPGDDADSDATRRLTAAYSALVERDFRTNKSVQNYAADLGVTPTHLSRVCNAACGRPASEILADRVFFEARQLLQNSPVQIKSVADELGFTSAAYFTRAFQKNTGQTPSNFRRDGKTIAKIQ